MGVLKNIRTREDLEYLVADLEELRSVLYKGKEGVKVPLIIKNDFEKASDKSEYLESLRKQILAVRILELTVSDYLDDDILGEVTAWVKENVGEDAVLSIRVQTEIVAGAKITFNGRYGDYSLKDEFEKAVGNIKL
jgi:F0F1-type ATP synthase delta subunit